MDSNNKINFVEGIYFTPPSNPGSHYMILARLGSGYYGTAHVYEIPKPETPTNNGELIQVHLYDTEWVFNISVDNKYQFPKFSNTHKWRKELDYINGQSQVMDFARQLAEKIWESLHK